VGIPLTINLTSIKRQYDLDRGVFKFSVYPPLLNINRMNLTNYVDLICQNTTYEVTEVKYFNGELTIKAEYTTDMEGRSCMLDFAYNSSIIRSPDSIAAFDANSSTAKLIIPTNQRELYIIQTIFTAFGFISVAIFLISLGYKMVGAETTTCCQMVYLANALYSR
jgi:hypothetical protein